LQLKVVQVLCSLGTKSTGSDRNSFFIKFFIKIIKGEAIVVTLVTHTAKKFHEVLTGKLRAHQNELIISLALYLLDKKSLLRSNSSPYPLKLSINSAVYNLKSRLLERLFHVKNLDVAENGVPESKTSE
jgi:hypothetical protein